MFHNLPSKTGDVRPISSPSQSKKNRLGALAGAALGTAASPVRSEVLKSPPNKYGTHKIDEQDNIDD